MRLLKIGRDVSCDIVLNSGRVSSLHAELTLLDNGDILLEDKNSRNGTFIMNTPIKSGTQVNVKRGDAIRFADVELLWSQVPLPEDNSNYKAVYGIGTNFQNDILLVGGTASRFHATLKIDRKGRAFIIDHSKNGTTVNGQHITSNKPYRVKKSDSIVCGGCPVNISQYIRNDSLRTISIVAAALALVVGLSFGVAELAKHSIDSKPLVAITPATDQAMENASVCVYGAYYFVVTLKDDPIKDRMSDWPGKFYVGQNGVTEYFDFVKPFGYTGTAFFISGNGEMGTNRHVAVPWEKEYRVDSGLEDFIRNQMTKKVNRYAEAHAAEMPQSAFYRLLKSDFEITGEHAYFGVALAGTRVGSIQDLLNAQVIAESGDPKKDVALIRLNSRKTPDYIVNMGAIYNLDAARIDETSLSIKENLTIVGYPGGEYVANSTFDGKEIHPTTHRASISKTPDNNQMQIQTVSLGGQSGSPVSDEKHRLVGVLWGGIKGSEVTMCTNIKHLVDLYEKNKVK